MKYLNVIDADTIEVILVIEIVDSVSQFLILLIESVHLLLLGCLVVLLVRG
jgi:hypothetical protein